MKSRLVFSFARILVVLIAVHSVSLATPISGQLNFGGTAVVSLLGLDFVPLAGGTGSIVVLPGGNTGSFAPLNAAATFGTIVDRTEALQPVGQTINIPNWILLAGMPDVSFTLEFIRPGGFSSASCLAPAANQQTCTLPPFDPDGPGPEPAILSPYNLTNFLDTQIGALSSTASFSVSGTVIDLSTMTVAGHFDGIFNASFQGIPYQELVSTALAGGSVIAPFSAQIDVTPIPEPSSALTGLAGIVLLAAASFRYRRR